MVMRWVAGAYLITEKNFRKIMGHQHLWTLAAVLGRAEKSVTLEEKSVIRTPSALRILDATNL
jgi:hypothetical protein